jgi:hypothetical protein
MPCWCQLLDNMCIISAYCVGWKPQHVWHVKPGLSTYLGYLFCFKSISWGCLTSSTFYFGNEPIWLAHHQKKKVDTMEAPQNRKFYGKIVCLPLAQVILGTSWVNTWGTPWECHGNKLGTDQKKNPLFPISHMNPRSRVGTTNSWWEPFCMEFFFCKGCTFWEM